MEELKKMIETLQAAFAEFKRLNDERIKQLETKGSVDPLLEKSVDKANTDITRLEGEVKAMQTAMARRGTEGSEKSESEKARELQTKAFNKLVRKGEDRLSPEEMKTLSTVNDAEGGYLVPEQMESGIIRSAAQVNAVRGLVNVRQISQGNSLEQLRRTAGVTGAWAAELASNPSAETPNLGMLKIEAEEMRVLVKATPNLLEDAAFNVEGWIADEAGEAFGNLEGAAFLSGSGVGKPKGMLSYASGTGDNQVEQVVSGTAATIADSDGQANGLITMQHKLKAIYAGNAKWLMNRLTVGSVRKLKDAQKQYIWSPGLGGQPPTILGHQYIEDDSMPVEGAGNLVAVFGDFKKFYKVVDKIGIAITRDPYSSKPQIEFLFRKRTGGAVEIFEAAKILKCST